MKEHYYKLVVRKGLIQSTVNVAIEIDYLSASLNDDCDHIEFYGKAISETGYKSEFISVDLDKIEEFFKDYLADFKLELVSFEKLEDVEFEVRIRETLRKTVLVFAKSTDEAIDIVERKYQNEEIMLGAEDFDEFDMSADISSPSN